MLFDTTVDCREPSTVDSIENSDLQPDCTVGPKHDDIKIEYHPCTKHSTVIMDFEEYSKMRMNTRTPTSLREGKLPDEHVYHPFQTRTDFEISEFALEACLNEAQTNKLLSLIHRIADGNDKFTIASHREMRKLWDLAANKLVQAGLTSLD